MGREVFKHRLLFLTLLCFIGLWGAINAGNAQAVLTDADCAVCHAVVAADPITPHHNLAFQQGKSCSECHRQANPGCTDCHGDPIVDPAFHENAHNKISIATDCAACHGSPDIIEVTHMENCFGCHESTDPNIISIIDNAIADPNASVNCETCHGMLGNPQHADPDHSRINIFSECATCHGDPEIVGITHLDNCATCHSSPRPEVQTIIDNAVADPTLQVNCADCHGVLAEAHAAPDHTEIQISADCQECHGSPDIVPVTHLNNCATCHAAPQAIQDIIDAALNNTAVATCNACHGIFNVQHPEPIHDSLSIFPECATCHGDSDIIGVTHMVPSTYPCGYCHVSTDQNVIDTISAGAAGTPVNCSGCHGTLVVVHAAPNHTEIQISADCQACHGSVDIVPVTHNNNCATCHAAPQAIQDIIDAALNNTAVATCNACHGTFQEQHNNPQHNQISVFSECATCHGDADIVGVTHRGLCESCHTSTSQNVIDTIAAGVAGTPVDCSNCHGVLAEAHAAPDHTEIQISADCQDCHGSTDIVPVTHNNNCATCHAAPQAIQAIIDAALNNTATATCNACHGVFQEVHANVTHSNVEISQPCTTCHGVNQTPIGVHNDDCLLCHTSTRPDVIQTIEDGKAGLLVGCVDCHGNVDTTGLNHLPQHDTETPEPLCLDCHDPNVAREHLNIYPDIVENCFICHGDPILQSVIEAGRSSNPNAVIITCADCHMFTTFETHNVAHTQVVLPSDGCIDCHDANTATEHVDVRGWGCTTCHSSTRQDVQDAIASGKAGNLVNCTDCHQGPLDHAAQHDHTFLNAPECADCHSANVVTEHVDNQGFGCGICHDDPLLVEFIINPGMAGTDIFCQDCHIPPTDHTNAHNMTDVTDPACLECHDSDVSVEHVTNNGLSCTVCHGNPAYDPIIDSGKGDTGTLVTCDACHGANAGDHVAAHDMTRLNTGNCADCHNANVVTEHVTDHLLSCSTCHSSTDPAVQAAISAGQAGQEVFCSDCHVGAGMHTEQHDMVILPEAYCADCHAGNVVIEHVDNRGLSCDTCHGDPVLQDIIQAGMNGTALDCLDCHMTTDHITAHDNTDVPSPECADCHNGNVATEHFTDGGLSCLVCHGNTAYDAIIAAGQAGTLVTCTDCHGVSDHRDAHDMTVVPQPVCADCHDPNVVVEHVDNRGLDCGVCHNATYQSIIDSGIAGNQVSCLACHGDPDHHTNSNEALTGNCTHCHAPPNSAMDAPVQGACRQCHINSNGYVQTFNGTTVHAFNTNGAIQDFGACFACHSPQPYHGKPNTWPGFFNENAVAPGRGSFNIFFSQFNPSCAPDCEGTFYEDLNGYGEDGQPQRDGGDTWRNPAINFDWVTIEHMGNMYDVPAFSSSPMNGGGGDPPTMNDSVVITYADYSSWSDRLTVYAENALDDGANLSLTWCGDSYSMSYSSNNDRWEKQVDNVNDCGDVTVTSDMGGSDTATPN